MYQRFTDRARKVMLLATEEAQRLRHPYIGAEHILLGLVKEGSGVAANVLKTAGVDMRRVSQEVEKLAQSGLNVLEVGELPQTPRAKSVIRFAVEESRNLKHNYVGTEHILLGLLHEQEGVAAQALMNLGLTLDGLRGELLSLLGFATLPVLPSAPSLEELARAHDNDPSVKSLLAEIEALDQEKTEAVADEDFEAAIPLRDRLRDLRSQLQQLLKSITPEEKDDRESGGKKDA